MFLFNREQYESLVEILGADKTLAIYGEFKRDAGARFAGLRAAMPREAVNRELHSMASMAGNMGFARMESECRRLMDIADTMPEELLVSEMRALYTLYEQGCAALERVYGRPV